MSFRLNHRQVEAFRAVFLTGSMTLAGEMIGISQPAVSRLIRDLEEMIGLKLFNRQGVKIAPTSDASILFQEVERSFRGLDRVARTAQELAQKRGGILRITTTYAISQFLLPPVLSKFRSIWPDVTITLHTASSPEIVNLMEMQHYDLGIAIRAPGLIDLQYESLGSVEAVCVVHESHPLAVRHTVSVEDLHGQPLLSLPVNSEIQPRINAVIDAAGVVPQRILETSFASTICSLVANKVGLAVIDPFTATGFQQRGLVSRKFEPTIQYDLNLVASMHRAQSKITESAVSLIRAQYNEITDTLLRELLSGTRA